MTPPSAPTTSRREFLRTSAALAATTAIGHTPLADAQTALVSEATLAADPQRPQCHLLPARNWMNDPNGPIFANGRYHMFFQYNPHAAVWGDMSWNHAVSRDMVHWQLLPVAMTPTPGSFDSFGVFSGSTLQAGRRVYAFYTGTRKSSSELATIRDGANDVQESQCLMWSDDPDLRHWTKADAPLIPLPPAGMQVTGFRDPSVWKQGDCYYMTVGAGEAKVGGCVLLYRSHALDHGWEYRHKLTSGTWNGHPTPNPCDDGEMWECPDFFALDGRHLLIYSTLGKVYWQSGELDATAMVFHPAKTGLLDLDAFYAPKTQLDEHGRRIVWGWIPERRSEDTMRAAGWSGMMSLPRQLNLDADGTLRITTPGAVQTLRGAAIAIEESRFGVHKILPTACAELLCTGTAETSYEMRLHSQNGSELLHVQYVAQSHSFLADGREFALQPGDVPTLHAYVDGSVIEVLLGERIGYTKRFYVTTPTAMEIRMTVSGLMEASVQAWTMLSISPNRLTTVSASTTVARECFNQRQFADRRTS